MEADTVKSTIDQMKWVNALSTRPSLEAAVAEVTEQAQKLLSLKADLAIVFISSTFASEFPRLMPLLKEHLDVPMLIGCGGGGTIGMARSGLAQEVEGKPALSLTLAHLPGVEVKTFHIPIDTLPDLDSSPDTWMDLIGVSAAEHPQFILLSDPFSSNINDLLQGLDFAYPESIKVGGLASTGAASNSNGLFCDYQLYREGTVGVALSGNIVVEAIVAQGCRPIGQLFQVMESERNILLSLEEHEDNPKAKPLTPLEALQNLLPTLSESDRALAQNSLFVGVARNSFKQNLEQGDFLIRVLLGVDPRNGAIAVGDRIRPGQRIQFHLRDAQASAEDLDMLLQRYQAQERETSAAGAFMFACLGRGEGLYGEPDFDSHLFSRYVNQVPIGGFFCNGEIGPVGDSTFLHGFTTVFGIFRQP